MQESASAAHQVCRKSGNTTQICRYHRAADRFDPLKPLRADVRRRGAILATW